MVRNKANKTHKTDDIQKLKKEKLIALLEKGASRLGVYASSAVAIGGEPGVFGVVDYMTFSPSGTEDISGIEKGVFTCYMVRTSYKELYSDESLNFVGERNYLVTTADVYARIVDDEQADKEKGEPDVYIDGSKILFSDQNAVIVDDITLVPARGVFEAMGNKVDWDGDARKVTVTSSTGVREVVLTIDSDKMAVKTYKTLFEREDKDITLEVPAKIMNERTMIPLRAVSEAFDCKVDWDGEAYRVDIATGEPILLDGYKAPEKDESKMVGMSLSTDAETVAAGEEFTVYVNATNIPEASRLTGIVATFGYDKNMFEYVDNHIEVLNLVNRYNKRTNIAKSLIKP